MQTTSTRPIFIRFTWIAAITLLYGGAVSANGWEHTAIPVSALFHALQSEDSHLRKQAVHSLGHHHRDDVSTKLIELISSGEPNPSVRRAAFMSIGKIGDPRSLTVIDQCLDKESDRGVRLACAKALGGIQSARAEKLTHQYLGTSKKGVASTLLIGLGNYPNQSTLKTLKSELNSNDNSRRLAAIRALGESRMPQAIPLLEPMLAPQTTESDKIAALKALAQISNGDIPKSIETIYTDNANPRLRRYALIALAAFDAEAGGILDALQSDDPLLQMQALESLRENQSAHIDVIASIGMKRADKLFSRLALKKIDDAQAIIIELSLLNEYLRSVIALDPHHADALFNVVTAAIEIPRHRPDYLTIAEGLYRLRWQGLYGLGYTHPGSGDEQLRIASKDSDARIRAVAIRSMGVSDPARFAKETEAAIKDASAEVRWQAAIVMGRDKSRHNIVPLLTATGDSYSRVRAEAALSLGYIGKKQAVQTLRIMAKDDTDAHVRASATYALKLLLDPN